MLKEPCKLWTGYVGKDGYARRGRGRSRLVHRQVWVEHHGPIPDGKEVDHKCRNRSCIEITHLQLVTHAENMALVPRKWLCPAGHLLRGKNLYINPKGYRICRTCSHVSRRRYKERMNG